jgi:hypothetical protein
MKYGIYILIAVVVVYLVSRLVFQGSALEVPVTTTTQVANPTAIVPLNITSDGRIRIKPGGEYTFSFWVYINSWGAAKAKGVLSIVDAGLSGQSLLSVLLYPSDPMMAIRINTTNSNTNDLTKNTTRQSLLGGTGSLTNSDGTTPQCDIQAIDLQRWINVTVCTNGRVADIYYDGKLNRSCVLPGIINAGTSGMQMVQIGEGGGFQGSFGVMNYYGYALTPDRIYSIYLAGPGGPPSFLSYLSSKLGINLTYTSA